MNIKFVNENFVVVLVVMLVSVPAQIAVCQEPEGASTEIVTLSTEIKKEPVVEIKNEVTNDKKVKIEESDDSGVSNVLDESGETDETDNSTLMWVGIGAGAVAVIGGALALSGGGGGSGDSESEPIVAPTSDSLVDPWQAEGRSPGSGKTYTGTFHLYVGGTLGYDLQKSDGEHMVGGGSWGVSDYQLKVYTDHGSRYQGSFTPAATYTTIDMSASNGWSVTLTR